VPHRLLDVLFQYLGRMAIGLVLVPVLVGALFYATDRSQTLTVRLWAEYPVYLSSASLSKEFAGVSPAAGGQTLAAELLASDSFLDQVLGQAGSGFRLETADQRATDRALVRSRLRFAAPGPNLLVMSYSSDDAKAATRFLEAFIAALGDSVVSIQTAQAAQMVSTVVTRLPAAQAAMQDALAQVHSYGAGETPAQLARDPRYQTLVADAQAKTSYYISLEDLSHQAQLLKDEIPRSRGAMLRVLDPPRADPKTIDLKSPLVRNSLLAFGAVAAIEAMLLYVLAVRDPRVRGGGEIRAQLGIPFLGSTPRVAAR
jgi:hypothetical protein